MSHDRRRRSSTCSLALLLAPLLPGVINRTKAFFAGRRGPAAAAALLRPREAPAQGRGLQPHHHLGVPRRARSSAWPPSLVGAAARPVRRRRRRSLAFPGDSILLRLPARPDALLHGPRRARHRVELRGHGREPRGARSRRWPSRRCSCRPGRAGAPSRQRLALGRLQRRAASMSAAPGGAAARCSSARRCPGRLPGGERPHPLRRPEHAPRADHDPRGDGPRPQRPGPGVHPVRRGAQALGARRAARGHRCCRSARAHAWLDLARWRSAGMLALAVAIGVVESTMARLRLVRVPQLLVAARRCCPLWPRAGPRGETTR